VIDREEYSTFRSQTFLSKIFDGSLTSMFAHFVDNHNLSEEESQELQAILDKNEVN